MGQGERCSYGVLSTAPGFAPTPDYWLALLHTRLMGRAVLNVSLASDDGGGGGGGGGQGPRQVGWHRGAAGHGTDDGSVVLVPPARSAGAMRAAPTLHAPCVRCRRLARWRTAASMIKCAYPHMRLRQEWSRLRGLKASCGCSRTARLPLPK
jgi:hypothetical protein